MEVDEYEIEAIIVTEAIEAESIIDSDAPCPLFMALGSPEGFSSTTS